jgi:hypothetical protein
MTKIPRKGKRVTVTPRMLRAGAVALTTMGGNVSDYEVVGVIYRAMAAVAPQSKSADGVQAANFLEVMRLMSAGRRDV